MDHPPAGQTPPFTVGADPVIEVYKRDVDRTLLRQNLQLTIEERFQQFESFMRYFYELRAAGRQGNPSIHQRHG